ncbi:periplasmic nitrate reductase subunit NapB [Nicoletella semolina]|uniref:Periplasmic nitrate reductase, electron transfer subunit n=2 Tax=Nicoletella semolina TaxID=271160 RepID=A0A4R2N8W2_9PAST|nr:nitrate reductase cytochrome c-type subunit [Nicoletella semolina]MDH2924462.1 diacylglycerol kinase [Nicoletella semolina]TCP17413.1 periplasmic nitrate reductase subunit NapB [Nicoletella semolina]
MKKIVVMLSALLVMPAMATEQSALGRNYQDSVENVAPAFHLKPKERELAALSYVNQPPMVPHSVEGYQVTKNVNQCLTCHSAESSRMTGATRISPTHFTDRDGNIVAGQTAPRRYFCLSCHVPMADVEPIVPNEFKPMPGYHNN